MQLAQNVHSHEITPSRSIQMLLKNSRIDDHLKLNAEPKMNAPFNVSYAHDHEQWNYTIIMIIQCFMMLVANNSCHTHYKSNIRHRF